jgi:hypothetical protein
VFFFLPVAPLIIRATDAPIQYITAKAKESIIIANPFSANLPDTASAMRITARTEKKCKINLIIRLNFLMKKISLMNETISEKRNKNTIVVISCILVLTKVRPIR